MDITKLPLFETMRERLSFLTARQSVLAENVANANTPGYEAKDVEAPDFAAMAAGEGGLRTTDPRPGGRNRRAPRAWHGLADPDGRAEGRHLPPRP